MESFWKEPLKPKQGGKTNYACVFSGYRLTEIIFKGIIIENF